MKFIDQTILHKEGSIGNCLQASIATACQCDLNEVPHFALYDDWFERMESFLNNKGFIIDHPDEPIGLCLVFGMSARNVMHSVLYKDGELFHDPHPDKSGVLNISWFAKLTTK